MSLAIIILLVLIGLLVANAITVLIIHALRPDPFDWIEQFGLLMAYIAFPVFLIGIPWRIADFFRRRRAR